MTFDQQLDCLTELVNALGIEVHLFEHPYKNIAQFDQGIRKQFFESYEYLDVIESFSRVEKNTIYSLIDYFELRYILFRHLHETTKDNKDMMVVIGPYISHDFLDTFAEVTARLKLPLIQVNELKEYYGGIPKYENKDALESQILALVRYILGNIDVHMDRGNTLFDSNPESYELRLEPENYFSYAIIEERYEVEDALLNAVERGDLEQALLYKNNIHKYKIESRNSDSLRNYKNFCITFNSLLRKAVQKAAVHPAYIDKVSATIAQRIEAVTKKTDLNKIMDEILRKYCYMVQNHSLNKYSKNIRTVMNYIDFQYTEQISLSQLAQLTFSNASYLSTQFKKETGYSIVEYINYTRIQRSLFLLATTDLPISLIAEKVGYLDENYYTRQFKKQMLKAPREYRRSLQI